MGVDQGLGLRRQLAEAVDDLLQQGVDLVGVLRGGELLVERQPQVHVAAVVVGQQGGGVQVDLGRDRQRRQQVGLLPGLERAHGLAEHLVVELEADLHHVAALVLAEHLAGAADLEVVHREVEARAQLLHLLDRVEPLRRLLGQALGVGHHEVGIGLVVRTADAAAQLVQLRQAELVGAAHHDGVGCRHVDAGLDDGRAQQEVVALGHEVAHHALEFALGHLAVGHGDARLGQDLLELLAPVLDGLDLVVQEVDLAAALELAQHRLADHAGALVANEGLDRQPALRRGGDHAEVAQALERHAQRAGDRRGGEREHVDLGAQRLHGLFMAHAEAVLLVDDQQPEVLELDRFREQLVGADHDVDGALGQALGGGRDFLGRTEAAHLGHLHRPLGEAVDQGLVVLLGQQRGGREEGHLLAAGDGDECRAQRDLGLAETDVAADQAVHRLRRDHVLHHGMDRGLLVGGFLEAKVVGEHLVVGRRIAEGMALARGAARVDVEQLGGRVAHLLGGLALGLVPLARAQLVQRRLVGADAGVAAHQVQLAHGHVERGLVGVLQVQHFLQQRLALGIGALAQVHVDQAAVAADAVRGVHHRVAHVELRQVLDQRLDVADLLLLLVAAPAGAAGGEQLGLGDEVDALFAPGEAGRQRGGGDADLLVGRGLELGQRIEGRRAHAAGAQEVEQALAPAVALRDHQHAVRRGGDVGLEPHQRIVGAAHHREGGQGVEFGEGRGVGGRADRQLRMRLHALVELLGVEEQRLGRQRRALGIAAHQAVALAGVLPEVLERGLELAVQHDGGVLAQVIEHGRRLVEEQRQVVLDAGGGHAVAHVLVDAALGRVALEQLAPAAAKARARVVVHRELAARQQPHLGHRVEAALGVGVEGADRVDLVVEQVDAVGHRRAHREQVDQAAAHRVLARAHHLRDVGVAGQRELRLELGVLQLLLRLEMEGVAREEGRRRQPVERGGGGHQHHVGFLLADAPQRGQALADQVLVRREAVVGQRLPVGKQGAAQLGREEGDLVDQALGIVGIGREHGRGAARGLFAPRELGQQQRIGRQRGARQREALARREMGEVHKGLLEMHNTPRRLARGVQWGRF